MRFLVEANLPRSFLALLRSFGHTSEHVRDVGLGAAPDSQIAARARATGSVLVTRDLDFANIRDFPPADYPGLIVLRLPDDATAEHILNVLRQFLLRTDLVTQTPGHLVIIEKSRVRFRPALGS
jgi:predicted nuclease of predicted toxin-antitoxin system